MKIKLEKEKCIGCGSCESVCPDVFEIGDDTKAHFKKSQNKTDMIEIIENSADCAAEAIEICPVQAIVVEK